MKDTRGPGQDTRGPGQDTRGPEQDTRGPGLVTRKANKKWAAGPMKDKRGSG